MNFEIAELASFRGEGDVGDVKAALRKGLQAAICSVADFAALISPAPRSRITLEVMAQRAHAMTIQHFRAALFDSSAPLYLRTNASRSASTAGSPRDNPFCA